MPRHRQRNAEVLRSLITFIFLLLGFGKLMAFYKWGLEPYLNFARTLNWPEGLKYYGVGAMLIEFYLALGVWFNKTFQSALVAAACLCWCGVLVSVYSLAARVISPCGCGLLGENEWGLLFQKLFLLLLLTMLYRRKTDIKF